MYINGSSGTGGKIFEGYIAGFLLGFGYQEAGKKDLYRYLKKYDGNLALSLQQLGDGVFVQQAKCLTNIYGGTPIQDIVLYHSKHFPNALVMELKSQHGGGSTDQKIPYTVLSLATIHPPECVLIMQGEGFCKGAVGWAEKEVAHHKNLRLFTSESDWHNWFKKYRCDSSVITGPPDSQEETQQRELL